MRNFILDQNPKFYEAKVKLGNFEYHLKRIQNNGCYFSVWENGLERDQITLTTTDMEALYLLLTTPGSK